MSEYGHAKLHYFAKLLLKDDKHVPSPDAQGNKEFLQNVLLDWLRRNDSDKDDPAHPRSWKALAYCLHEMDDELGVLARDLRQEYA